MIASLDSPPGGPPDPRGAPNPFSTTKLPDGVGLGNMPAVMKLYMNLLKNQATNIPTAQKNNPFAEKETGQVTNPDLNNYLANPFIQQLLRKYF